MQNKQYDIVIIGAGIVGAASALAFAKTDLKIAILNQQSLITEVDETIDLRTSAINLASRDLLQEIGVWPTIESLRLSAYDKMTVWDKEGSIHFDCAEIGEAHLGFIIENKIMQVALNKQIQSAKNIDYLTLTPQALYTYQENIVLLLSDHSKLQTKLVIGADGANSWLRQAAGIKLIERSYEQVAIIANVKTENPHQQTAWQHFTPTGPVAFLPLQNQHICSIVWSCETKCAETLLALDPKNFIYALNQAFEDKLGQLELISKRKSFSLIMRHAKSYVAPRIVLLGDALHTIHPLAGLGLNLGLKEVACLIELIKKSIKMRQDYGAYYQLLKFERARKQVNSSVLFAMQGFKQLFANESLSWLRNEGLKLTNRSTLLKKFIFQRAAFLN
ncbi:MAG: hypothetical protein A3E87_02710 [Gammaproteobacteria bacterium RIFCSPHIGHO2_12_FULL_35_23]|nr:MAG: hypothetical protein A3E87_02710 [Gammaproteobacteria bacterium RIFCSPHIGHO2_12_FULL_35_23]